jgi:RNA polymerase II subunit A small phosphatase-like protein
MNYTGMKLASSDINSQAIISRMNNHAHSQNHSNKLQNNLNNPNNNRHYPYNINVVDKNNNSSNNKNQGSANKLIANVDKQPVNIVTRNIVQTARNNQPAVFNNRDKNFSLSPSKINTVTKKFLPDIDRSKPFKKTLILDLDETLVHSGFKPFKVPSDILLKIELEGRIHDIHVLIRPGASEFLEKMAEIYELVIFTASLSKVSVFLFLIFLHHIYLFN